MKNRTYEETLPDNYEEVLTIDCADKKTMTKINVLCVILTVAVLVISSAIILSGSRAGLSPVPISHFMIFAAAAIAYIFLHELTHGAVYRMMTGQKLTYGFKFPVAYCGVPDIYVYRKTAMLSLLAPFIIFTAVFLAAMVLPEHTMDRLLGAVLLATHVGGCAGDLYDAYVFMTRLKDEKTLMRDFGPKQVFYLPK